MRDWIIGIESRGELYERLFEADPNEEDGDGDGDDGDMANGNEENAEDMMLIAVHEVVDEVPYVGENFAAAQIAVHCCIWSETQSWRNGRRVC